MKNQPVDVISLFLRDGKVKPIRFKHNDASITVQRILKTDTEHLAGNRRIIFTCQHISNSGNFTYELKYELDTCKWYLFT